MRGDGAAESRRDGGVPMRENPGGGDKRGDEDTEIGFAAAGQTKREKDRSRIHAVSNQTFGFAQR